jgi:FAD-linked sulfhydryl oxidase
MLEKPVFDCNDMGDFYDCGCKDDEKNGQSGQSKAEKTADAAVHESDDLTGSVEITKEP